VDEATTIDEAIDEEVVTLEEPQAVSAVDQPPIWLPRHEDSVVAHAAVAAPHMVSGYSAADRVQAALVGTTAKTITSAATAVAALVFLVMLPSLTGGGIGGALKLAFYQAWTLGLLLLATFRVRSISIGAVARYWLGGALAVAMVSSLLGGIVADLHDQSIVWITPAFEAVLKLAPLGVAVVMGRRAWRHPGLADLMVLGFAVGAGYGFHEESLWGRSTASGFGVDSGFFVPSIFRDQGQFIVGHAVWAALLGLALGLVLFDRRHPGGMIGGVLLAFVAIGDQMATNDSQGTLDPVRQLLFDGKVVALLFFVAVVAAIVLDHHRQTGTAERDHLFPDDRVRKNRVGSTAPDDLGLVWLNGRYRRMRNGMHNTVDAATQQWPPRSETHTPPVDELARVGQAAGVAVGPGTSESGWVADPEASNGHRFFGPNGYTVYAVDDTAVLSATKARPEARGLTSFERSSAFSSYVGLGFAAVGLLVLVRLLTAGDIDPEVTLVGLPHASSSPPLIRGAIGAAAAALGPANRDGRSALPTTFDQPNSPRSRPNMLVRTSLLGLDQAARVQFRIGDGLNLWLDDRRFGARQDDRTVSLRLTGSQIPENLIQVYVRGQIGATPIDLSVDPAPNLTFTHLWDGKSDDEANPGSPASVATELQVGWRLAKKAPRPERIRWWKRPIVAGGVDLRRLGCGGITPHVVHRYDPRTDTLWRGDGSRRVGAQDKNPRHLSRLRIAAGEIGIADGEFAHVFDASGEFKRTLSMTRGHVVASAHVDEKGRITSWSDAGHRYTIDRRNNSEAMLRSPSGVWAVIDFDEFRRAKIVTDQDKNVVQLGYDEAGGLANVIDSAGLVTEIQRDDHGRVVSLRDSTGKQIELERTELDTGFEVAMLSGEGRRRLFRSFTQADGAVVEEHGVFGATNPHRTEHRSLGPRGQETTVSTPDGMVATVQQSHRSDKLRTIEVHRTTIVSPGGKTAAIERRTARHRTGRSQQAVTLGESTIMKSLDPKTHSTTSTSGEGRKSRSVLVPGKSLSIESPANGPLRIDFDVNGRPRRRERPGEVMAYGYDQNGRLTWIDFERWRQHLHHDEPGRVSAIETPDGWIQIARDRAGRVEGLRTPANTVVTMDRRPDGKIEVIRYPEVNDVSETERFEYDLDGMLTAQSFAEDHVVDFERDHAGRVLNVTAPGLKITATYNDTTGHLESLASADGDTVQYHYDGRLEWAEEAMGRTAGRVERAFDDNHQVVARRINGVPLQYGRDRDGLVTSVGSLQIERSARGGLPVATRLGGLMTTREFDDFGRLTKHETRFGQLATVYFGELIERDDFGRVTKITETAQGRERILEYRYSESRRLAEVLIDGSPTLRLAYDGNGNITELDRLGRLLELRVDAADRLVAVAGQPTTYTNSGCLTAIGVDGAVRNYQVDGLGRTIGSSDAHHHVSHSLDAVGRPLTTAGEIASWRYLWDGDRLAALLDADGEVDIRYIDSGVESCPEALSRGGVLYLMVKDHLGSVRAIVNAHDGRVVRTMDYDALGRPTTNAPLAWQPFGFAGGLQDANSGMIRFRTRTYDPFIGRFLSRDPLGLAGGQTNLFQYALGDPVNNIDPSGMLVGPSGEIMVTDDAFLGKRPLAADHIYLQSRQWIADVKPLTTLGVVGRLLESWTQASTFRTDASRSLAAIKRESEIADVDTRHLLPGEWSLTDSFSGPEWDVLRIAAQPAAWEFDPMGWDEGPGATDVARRLTQLPESFQRFKRQAGRRIGTIVDDLGD